MARQSVTCVRCGQDNPSWSRAWPEGRVCGRCFQRAARRRGTCPGCSHSRLLPGLSPTGQAICADCAGIPTDFHCTRCGEEDEPYRKGLCARCCLRDKLTALLDDGHGAVREQIRPLFEALCGQQNPRSAIIWMRKTEVLRLLRGFADGSLPITHDTFDASDRPRVANHLRELFSHHGALQPRNRVILLFEAWLENKLAAYPADIARLLREFATWHQLRGMRERAATGTLKSGAGSNAKQEITVSGELLLYLNAVAGTVEAAGQEHLDGWLAAGPTTRFRARTFVLWAARTNRLPALQFPYRKAATTPVMAQEERLRLLRRCLDASSDLPLAHRVAGTLLLLYAQPITRICELRLSDVVISPEGVELRLGQNLTTLPRPFADLLQQHIATRANMATASNADAPWLFRGYCPGQPLNHIYLMNRLRDAGIHLRGARNAALRQLVLDMPPTLVAQALGYHPAITEAHARDAGATWVTYASYKQA